MASTSTSSTTKLNFNLNLKNKITPEQWQRLNAVAEDAVKHGMLIEDGQTDKAEIEDEAVERFVQFLENYYVF